MWERMSESEGGPGSSMDFLSTHPANTKRIKVSYLPRSSWHTAAEEVEGQQLTV